MAIPLVWIVGIILPLMRRDGPFDIYEGCAIASPISLVAAGFFIWRIARIHHLFTHGQLTTGHVTCVSIVRDRGRLEFTYDFQGHSIDSWTPVHRNRRVLSLEPDQEVEVLVDKANPKNAIVRHLYV